MNDIHELLDKPKIEKSNEVESDIMFHYYGDRVRQLFFAAAVIMLVGLPFVRDTLALPTYFSVIAILTLDFLAGLANPKQRWVNWANTLTAAFAMSLFEFFAVRSFESQNVFFLVVNQLLALLFLVAVYFNTKTLRNMILK